MNDECYLLSPARAPHRNTVGRVSDLITGELIQYLRLNYCGGVVQDVRPSRVEGVNQPIHEFALRALGTPLIDNCDLEGETAFQRRRWTFLLTINPLRVPGATGGPVNPIATF